MVQPQDQSTGAPIAPADRLVALDAYRGFIMLMMVSAEMGMAHLRRNTAWNQEHPTLSALADQFSHRLWEGCTFWDLIQPSFMFIVGVAMPFSFARRQSEGQGWWRQFGHAVKRSLLLIAIGIFLDSYGQSPPQMFVQFIRVLQQIAIGYLLAFFVLHLGPKVQAATALLFLVAHTLLYIVYGGDLWGCTHVVGTYNDNVGVYLDRALGLPLSRGHYVTLNALSSAATILFGVLAGELLRSSLSSKRKLIILAGAGVTGLLVGWALSGGDGWLPVSFPAVVPMIKRLWTSSFAVYAGGWTCLMLALFFLVIDMARFRAWSFPFAVVGMNCIAVYVLASTLRGPMERAIGLVLPGPHGPSLVEKYDAWMSSLLGRSPWAISADLKPVLMAFWMMAAQCLLCLWLYRRRIFFRL
jgi:predicted acyltransferase